MIKTLFSFSSIFLTFALNAQSVVYDFVQNPLSNGWSSVIDAGSGNGITYDASSQQIQFDITTGVNKNFIHRTLPSELKEPFCISFKIRPEASNQNSFFPMLLTPNSLSGPNDHPWRMNTPDNFTAGAIQTLDLLGVFITHMEIKFINRNDNNVPAGSIVSFTQPFNMSPNTDYWVKLEVIDALNTRLSVFSDESMTSTLRTQIFPTPNLDPFNEIYIANCNGNSATSIYGKLDDYRINNCNVAFVDELNAENDSWLLFPNPSSSIYELKGTKKIDLITVYDLKGSKVVHESIINNNLASVILNDANDNGVYILEISAEDGTIFRTRIILQK
jgi:hypothetical protein